MKSVFKKMMIISALVGGSVVGLASCKSNVKVPVTFVAVSTSEYNTEVQVGNYKYKFKGSVDQKSDKFTLKATAMSKVEQSGGGGGGGSGPGGCSVETPDFLPVDGIRSMAANQGNATSSIKLMDGEEAPEEDLSAHDWSVDGTYVFEEGWGYTITLQDANKTVIHADFNKTEGRHEFYYEVNIEGNKSVVHFQAKDAKFKTASGYQTWDKRDSKYIFTARATGNNNSLAYAYLYLHSDGSANINAPTNRGAGRTVTIGLTWTEQNGQITVFDGQTPYVATASKNAQHPGYKLAYGGSTYICSTNPDVKWKNLAIADFDGEAKYTFNGSYTTSGPDGGTKSLTLNLGVDGKANLYEGWSALANGEWVEADGEIVITFNNENYHVNKNADGKYEFTYVIVVAGMCGDTRYEVTLTQE